LSGVNFKLWSKMRLLKFFCSPNFKKKPPSFPQNDERAGMKLTPGMGFLAQGIQCLDRRHLARRVESKPQDGIHFSRSFDCMWTKRKEGYAQVFRSRCTLQECKEKREREVQKERGREAAGDREGGRGRSVSPSLSLPYLLYLFQQKGCNPGSSPGLMW